MLSVFLWKKTVSLCKMNFNAAERESIWKVFDHSVSKENIAEYLTTDVYDFIKGENKIRTVVDTLTFVPKNEYRPYESCNLTKFLTKNFDATEFIESLTSAVSPPYLVYIDANFLILCPNHDSDEYNFKLQRASKASSMNDTIRIRNKSDYANFLSEFKNATPTDFLNQCFENHSDLFDYHGSGLRPHSLLSVVMYITKNG